MKPLKLKRKLTISDQIRSRLNEIENALNQGYTIKQIYDFLLSEEEINCSYDVFGNSLRRVRGGKRNKTEKAQPLATNPKEPLETNPKEPLAKQSISKQFVKKREFDLNDFENED